MIIIGGSASNGIDEKLAKILNLKLLKVEHKVFPDGESYIRIPESINNDNAVIIQSTFYPQDKHLIELFLIAEAAKNMGASKLIAVIPYLAYARQDRRFKDGEALSLKAILNLIYQSGIDEILTVEPHKSDALVSYFKGEVKIIDPTPALAKEIKKEVDDPFVLAPDRGALDRAERLSKELNSPFSYIEKERDRNTGEVRIKEIPRNIEIKGKDVVLIDDIISTGGTLAQAAKVSYDLGARKVIAAASHVLLVNNAYEKLKNAGIKCIIGTNSVKTEDNIKVADISELIAVKL
ncbi:ribose-phosphate diphosphokinase [Acidianus sulfidivorans JP7]|uniref:Ribose-phosphate pyrophosphokinase n=1 Tax=Acidianus sulfidivorans JP7 TaxID=619593 RepID=A0A2U9INU2_9CREN|nr:ribose-phosphate pyrophosphokinase [Acidianus sulfidivorans]AWR97671.1 ribose-phosphate diphosphokinase [Acidianus sulfidivorans JP7]